ncbi:hypothetical protein LWI29_030728 [Acer saccharum]|uniref:Transposase MuDR plant domain-containing protein n=1 Tax=Acer saccharum TaxID=4024 RepID=A0AA39VKH1_ACESA|nr:hypothetical protein LWI29_030728 [Acer saccharum]
MHEVLGLEAVVGDKFRQEIQFPWNAEVREIQNNAGLMDVLSEFEQRKPNNNPNQQPTLNPSQQPNINLNQQPNLDPIQQSNLEEEPIILTESSSNSNGSIMDDGEDELPNAMDDSEDEVPNEKNGIGDELPIDSGDENDGLSDVNKDDIVEEDVIDNPIMGTAFKLRDDGRIILEVGQLFRNSTYFREVLLDYSVQEGFKLRRIKNKKRRITYRGETNGCPWRAHDSPTFDRVTYMLKTLRNAHNCLAVPKNRDVTSVWLGKRFELLIKENLDINIRVLGSVILRQCRVNVPDHTLYRAKKFKLDYLRDIFWHAATSSNKVAFLKAMDEIKQTSLEVHAYLSNISVETWAVHAFDSVCKSEHNTNIVVEALMVG